MKTSPTNPPTSFVYYGEIDNDFLPDAQHNIIWIDSFEYAKSAKNNNVEQLRQGFTL